MEIYTSSLTLDSEISAETMHSFRKKVLSFPSQLEIHSGLFVPKIYGGKLTLF